MKATKEVMMTNTVIPPTKTVYDYFVAGYRAKSHASLWFLDAGQALGNNPEAMEGQNLASFRAAETAAITDLRFFSNDYVAKVTDENKKSSGNELSKSSAFWHVANAIRAYNASGANEKPLPCMTGEESLIQLVEESHATALKTNPGTYSVSVVGTVYKWATTLKKAVRDVAKGAAGPEAIRQCFESDTLVDMFESNLKAVAPKVATLVADEAPKDEAPKDEAPAPAPAPVKDEAPAPAPAPTPVTDEAPAPAPAPAPVTDEAPAPVADEAPAPVADEAPAPVTDEAPKGEAHDDESASKAGNMADMDDGEYGITIARLAAYLVRNKVTVDAMVARLESQIAAYVDASKPAPRQTSGKGGKRLATTIKAF
jgi:hypothetical protein